MDAFTRFSPAIEPRSSWRGGDVIVLERICRQYGYTRSIRIDHGPEFISKDLDLWACRRGVILDFSRPGKPTDNSFAETFNGKVRAECVDQNWFLSLADARLKCGTYRYEYKTERLHSSIGNKSPISLMNCSADHGPV